ncbi:membrane-associated protein, putative [Bodo saltans]|uniref:Membrane-associated protein, putative n=1 Tax=Bodo saltans TaxID=75058 RepID=A0A0S4IVK4_BODSA|nr:membrane-associated protein, putative [Bodo saltans]|eukprot:CUG03892.1 membrane-associated protein, putative [Bodo saltans]
MNRAAHRHLSSALCIVAVVSWVLTISADVALIANGAVLNTIRDLTINPYGQSTGFVDSFKQRCASDGRLPKNLFVNATSDPRRLVCSSLPTTDPCSLQTLRKELLEDDSEVTSDELTSVDTFMLMNISLAHPSYNWTVNSTIGSFPVLTNRTTPSETVSTWLAQTRYSKMNISSNCLCIDQVFLVTSIGRIVQDDVLINLLLQGPNSTDAVRAASEVVLHCVFGTAIGIAAPGGVGMVARDMLMYDAANGSLIEFQTTDDLSTALRALWSQAAWSDVMNPTFIDNRSATPALGHWPLLATSPVGNTLMQMPATTLVTMWFGTLNFCNIDISTIRYIINGVERSSGVVVEVDWSLLDVYAVLPLEMAKAMTILATVVDASTCNLFCGSGYNATRFTNINSTFGPGIATAPCRYTCLLVSTYQPLHNMTDAQRRDQESSLQWLLPPLFAQTFDTTSTTRALQLNLSFYLAKGVLDGQNYISFTTWNSFDDDVTPTFLLGGLFSVERGLNKAKYIVIDRENMQVGVSPTVSSVTLSSSTTPKLDDVCTPIPECGDDEVLIVEINRCVNTLCAAYFYMEVSKTTGQCWLNTTYVGMAGFLLGVIAVGEFLLTFIDFQTASVLRKMQAKSDSTTTS